MYKGILAQMSRHLVCHFHCKSLINMIRINLNQWTLNIKYTLYQKQSYLASRHFSKFHVRTTILCFSTDSSLQKFFLFENFLKKFFIGGTHVYSLHEPALNWGIERCCCCAQLGRSSFGARFGLQSAAPNPRRKVAGEALALVVPATNHSRSSLFLCEFKRSSLLFRVRRGWYWSAILISAVNLSGENSLT